MKPAPNKSKTPSPDGASSLPVSQERIRFRAYEIYLQQGRAEGRHLEHWLQAERELLGKQPEKRTK